MKRGGIEPLPNSPPSVSHLTRTRGSARQIGTKSSKAVIEFYYLWKKSKNYKKWKETFRAPVVNEK